MDIISIIIIAIGLAMDAFAIAVTIGISLSCFQIKTATRVANFFGGFQAFMPLVGWLSGLLISNFLSQYSHWIAFSILIIIGGKMLYEARVIEETKVCDHRNIPVLIGLAIATSIDAFAVGVTLSLMNHSILIPIILIGAITWVICYIGVFVGNKIGHLLENKAEVFGGIILILIACKILYSGIVQ